MVFQGDSLQTASILALLKEFEILKDLVTAFAAKLCSSSGDRLGPWVGRCFVVDKQEREGASQAALDAYTWTDMCKRNFYVI